MDKFVSPSLSKLLAKDKSGSEELEYILLDIGDALSISDVLGVREILGEEKGVKVWKCIVYHLRIGCYAEEEYLRREEEGLGFKLKKDRSLKSRSPKDVSGSKRGSTARNELQGRLERLYKGRHIPILH